MKTKFKRYTFILFACFLLSNLCGCIEAEVGCATKAKMLCTQIFACNVDESTANDLYGELYPMLNLIDYRVDYKNKTVTSCYLGIKRKAIYRENLGTTLVLGVPEEEIRSQNMGDLSPYPANQEQLPWPTGDVMPDLEIPEEVDMEKLTAAIDEAFSEPDPENPRNTMAVLVLYNGNIIAEHYAPEYSESIRFPGYSTTKSITSVLLGILSEKGVLSMNKPVLLPQWSEPDDPRNTITLNHLIRMSSGLEFDESYDDLTSDINIMMFASSDTADYAANKPLLETPGTLWNYSSGSTQLISHYVRSQFEGLYPDYYQLVRREIFDKIGMRSAIIEADPVGNAGYFAGVVATARDFARLGLFFAQDGTWEGERILPEGWMEYALTPTSSAPKGKYGAGFWLNAGTPGNEVERMYPDLPSDMYMALGFGGQFVTVFPSNNIIIVRLGFNQDISLMIQEHGRLGYNVLNSIQN